MWPCRGMSGPKWPTFRGAIIDVNHLNRIRSSMYDVLKAEGKIGDCKLIQVSAGWQFVRESANGGFVNGGGTRNEYPTISFELQCYVQQKAGKKSPMYLIGWIGGYGKGSIMHVGWQFPHCEAFDPEDLKLAALKVYPSIARLVYGDRNMDPEVVKFIQEVESYE